MSSGQERWWAPRAGLSVMTETDILAPIWNQAPVVHILAMASCQAPTRTYALTLRTYALTARYQDREIQQPCSTRYDDAIFKPAT